MSKRKFKLRTIEYFFGLLLAVGTLAPLIWMFITSISYPSDLTSIPLKLIPTRVMFDRFVSIFTDTDTDSITYVFRVSMGNSLVVAFFVTLIALIFGSVAAYAFARLKFRFKKSLLVLSIFVYMIPPVALVVPMYLIFSKLGMLNRKSTLVILYLSFIIPFIIWVMQSYFAAISKSYEEAAELDGCNRFQTLTHIFIPIARPGMIATGILAFLMSWDEFFLSLIFTSNLSAKTLTVAISEFNGKFTIDYGMISAAGVIASLLPALVVLIFQKYIVMGMTAGGVKE
jgi:multiple sugar transport system permease protein